MRFRRFACSLDSVCDTETTGQMTAFRIHSRSLLYGVLLIALGCSICMKVCGGLPADLSVPPAVVWSACGVELLALILLLLNQRVLGGCIILLLAIAGALVTIWLPGRCGCLGPVVISKTQHLWMVTVFGWAATAVAMGELGRAGVRGGRDSYIKHKQPVQEPIPTRHGIRARQAEHR